MNYTYIIIVTLILGGCGVLSQSTISETTLIEISTYNNKTVINYRKHGIAIMLNDTLKEHELHELISKKNFDTQLKETIEILSELPISKEVTLLQIAQNTLPTEFSLLKKTESIDISDLKHLNFEIVFSQLSILPNLKIIISSRNHYGELPASICKIKTLEKLFLHYSGLTVIPKCIAESPNLSSFGIAYGKNNVDTIASILSNSLTLDSLYLAGLNLTKLPDRVSDIKNLKYIDLFENNIKTLPCSLANRGISIDIEENRNYKRPDCFNNK